MTAQIAEKYPLKRLYSINEGKGYLNLNDAVTSHYRENEIEASSKAIHRTIVRLRQAAKNKMYQFTDEETGIDLQISSGKESITLVSKDYLRSSDRGYTFDNSVIYKSFKEGLRNALSVTVTDAEITTHYRRIYCNLITAKKYSNFDERTQLEIKVIDLRHYTKVFVENDNNRH
jgi:hypothetical protein